MTNKKNDPTKNVKGAGTPPKTARPKPNSNKGKK